MKPKKHDLNNQSTITQDNNESVYSHFSLQFFQQIITVGTGHTAEFFITSEQQRLINELLPKGYSLQFASKPVRQKSSSFTNNMAAYSRTIQLDMQSRNSNGQFTSQILARPSKPAKYGSGKLSSQDNFQMPSASGSAKCMLTPPQMYGEQMYNQRNMMAQPQNTMMIQQNNREYCQQQYPQQAMPQQPQYGSSQLLQSYDDQSNQSPSLGGQREAMSNRRRTGGSKSRKDKKGKQSSDKSQRLKRKNDGSMLNGKGANRFAVAAALSQEGMIPEEQRKCQNILNALQKHKCAAPFLKPVDPIKQGCADYLMVIRDPMDLSTVDRNIKTSQYQSATQFAADVRKIWNNSYLYNSRDSQIYHMTLEMDKYFEKKFKEMETSVFSNSQVKNIPYYVKIIAQAIKGNQAVSPPPLPRQISHQQQPKKFKSAPSKMDIPMTMQEKKNLGQSILQLPPDCLRGVWEIVQADSNQQYDDKVLQFDIDTLSVRKTRELEQYVKQKLASASKRLSKKSAKVLDKNITSENKVIQQTFCHDDETAATHHDTLLAQDMTQRTLAHTQQYQMPTHPSHYDQMHTQSMGAYTTQTQNDYMMNKHLNNHNSPAMENDKNNSHNDHNDIDSESSFISEDSDSNNY